MRSIRPTILPVLSLLLAVVAGIYWIRSHHVGDSVLRATVSKASGDYWLRSMSLHSADGGLSLMLQKQRISRNDLPLVEWSVGTKYHRNDAPERPGPILMEGPTQPWNRLGFFCVAWQRRDEYDLIVDVPYWWLTAILLIVPARALRSWRRRRHHLPTSCAQCGYDLRASTDTCPECGATRASDPGSR